MARDETRLCPHCGLKVGGYGMENLRKNYNSHLALCTPKERPKQEEPVKQYVEPVFTPEVKHEDLDSLKKDELLDVAAQRGLEKEVHYKDTKKELVKKLRKGKGKKK